MIASTTLYRCLDKLTAHKQEFFSFLRARWTTLFNARFDILLYDLTSTFFESDPPFEDKRQFGHSRDKRRFVSFIAYCLLVTLKNLARPQAPGLTPRAIVEKFAAIQMVDLHVPTADGRHLVLARHNQPSNDHELLLRQLDLALPKQPAPKLLS